MDDPLDAYVNAPTLEAAEQELDKLAGRDDVPVGDLYDELADLAAEGDEFAQAARLEEKAVAAGCSHPWLARTMRAWYLLEAGEIDAGEALFDELEAERPDDVELRLTRGMARADAELPTATDAFDDALAVAKRRGFVKEIDRARVERREHRQNVGLEPDEDDALAPERREPAPHVAAVPWFPPDQRAAAAAYGEDLGNDYDRRTERWLRDYTRELGERPQVAPVIVADYEAWAAEEGYDPADAGARRVYAAHRTRGGHAIAWPPGRNEPCWCGSGRKYKRCCGA